LGSFLKNRLKEKELPQNRNEKIFSVAVPILPRPVSIAFYGSGTGWARLLEFFFAMPLRLCAFACAFFVL